MIYLTHFTVNRILVIDSHTSNTSEYGNHVSISDVEKFKTKDGHIWFQNGNIFNQYDASKLYISND